MVEKDDPFLWGHPIFRGEMAVSFNIHEKLNGTKSQWTPLCKLEISWIGALGFLLARNTKTRDVGCQKKNRNIIWRMCFSFGIVKFGGLFLLILMQRDS